MLGCKKGFHGMKQHKHYPIIILGGGITGLSAGLACGAPIFEANSVAGGICRSYYVEPSNENRAGRRILNSKRLNGPAYRFEHGGGHWIFGATAHVKNFIRGFVDITRYERRALVNIDYDGSRVIVPYPIQNNIIKLKSCAYDAQAIADEIVSLASTDINVPSNQSINDWLLSTFGKSLCDIFFIPYHRLYVAGLADFVRPQDAYKTPINIRDVIKGAKESNSNETSRAGYNCHFFYPEEGLDALCERMASQCDVRYGKKITSIDTASRTVRFEDNTTVSYKHAISTIPLNRIIRLANINIPNFFNVYTERNIFTSISVVVVNIGGKKGKNFPDNAHWMYFNKTKTGFHRIGFYSNVSRSFLPNSNSDELCSIYVEACIKEGAINYLQYERIVRDIAKEVRDIGIIESIEVIDPSFVPNGYTYFSNKYPVPDIDHGLNLMHNESGIYQAGRYARWKFQGISESIQEGIIAGKIVEGLV